MSNPPGITHLETSRPVSFEVYMEEHVTYMSAFVTPLRVQPGETITIFGSVWCDAWCDLIYLGHDLVELYDEVGVKIAETRCYEYDPDTGENFFRFTLVAPTEVKTYTWTVKYPKQGLHGEKVAIAIAVRR